MHRLQRDDQSASPDLLSVQNKSAPYQITPEEKKRVHARLPDDHAFPVHRHS